MTTAVYIDTQCGGCGRRLRVAAEHAGKQARCPHCDLVYTVPARSTLTSAGFEVQLPQHATGDTWQMKSPDGMVFGPVAKEGLDRWRDEGRMTDRSQVLPPGGAQWLWATDVYPDLAPAAAMQPIALKENVRDGTPVEPTLHSYYASGIEPNRGLLVLVLSILGFTTACAIPSLMAVILGWVDLRAMKAGKMEPAGRGLTITGIVLGIFWTIVNLGIITAIVVGLLLSL